MSIRIDEEFKNEVYTDNFDACMGISQTSYCNMITFAENGRATNHPNLENTETNKHLPIFG